MRFYKNSFSYPLVRTVSPRTVRVKSKYVWGNSTTIQLFTPYCASFKLIPYQWNSTAIRFRSSSCAPVKLIPHQRDSRTNNFRTHKIDTLLRVLVYHFIPRLWFRNTLTYLWSCCKRIRNRLSLLLPSRNLTQKTIILVVSFSKNFNLQIILVGYRFWREKFLGTEGGMRNFFGPNIFLIRCIAYVYLGEARRPSSGLIDRHP